jgi:hypothetical protein
MKKFRFFLAAFCISAAVAGFTHANASANVAPLCLPSPDDSCFGIPDDTGGPIGWYRDYIPYSE